MSETGEAYGDDLAFIHDTGFAHFATNAAPGLLEMLSRHGIDGGLVVDFGCGSGIWAQTLVEAGYEVLGVDISPAMIALARQRVPEADFRVESFLKAELPRCDAVTSLGECFNYLFDGTNGLRQLDQLFHRVYDALRPGGLFVFDMLEPGQLAGRSPRNRHRLSEDWAVLVEVEEDREARLLMRRITSFRKVGTSYRRSEEEHRLRLYTAREIAGALRAIGFRTRVLRGYGRFRLQRRHACFRARKP